MVRGSDALFKCKNNSVIKKGGGKEPPYPELQKRGRGNQGERHSSFEPGAKPSFFCGMFSFQIFGVSWRHFAHFKRFWATTSLFKWVCARAQKRNCAAFAQTQPEKSRFPRFHPFVFSPDTVVDMGAEMGKWNSVAQKWGKISCYEAIPGDLTSRKIEFFRIANGKRQADNTAQIHSETQQRSTEQSARTSFKQRLSHTAVTNRACVMHNTPLSKPSDNQGWAHKVFPSTLESLAHRRNHDLNIIQKAWGAHLLRMRPSAELLTTTGWVASWRAPSLM